MLWCAAASAAPGPPLSRTAQFGVKLKQEQDGAPSLLLSIHEGGFATCRKLVVQVGVHGTDVTLEITGAGGLDSSCWVRKDPAPILTGDAKLPATHGRHALRIVHAGRSDEYTVYVTADYMALEPKRAATFTTLEGPTKLLQIPGT